MKGYLFVYALTTIGVLGSLRKPIIGLYVYVLFSVLRPQFLWSFAGDMSNLSLMVGVAMVVGWTLHGFGEKRVGGAGLVIAMLLGFLCWTTMSAVQAINSDIGLRWVLELMKIVAPFLIGVTLLDRKDDLRWMLWVIVIAQTYVSFEMNRSYYFDSYNRASIEGFGGMDNNSFGISLVTTIGPAFALMLTEKGWIPRLGAAASCVLILHAILLTFSRGAMVGLVAVGFAAFVLMPKRPSYILAMVLAVLLTARLTGPQLMARYSSSVVDSNDRDESAESRFLLWRDCLDVASNNPLFGVGPQNWPIVASRYGWPPGKEAHSTWMQTTAEMGFPGVFLLLGFFLVDGVKLWPLARHSLREDNRFQVMAARAVVMSTVGFVVAGQFVTLTGLEVPYYLAMIGAVILKGDPVLAIIAPHRSFATGPADPLRPGGRIVGGTMPPRSPSVNAR